MRRSSRTLALASAVTSLAYFSQLYGNLRFRYALPNHGSNLYIHHWNLHLAGYAASGVGFLMAGAGFWIGSTATRRPDPVPSDSDLVGLAP